MNAVKNKKPPFEINEKIITYVIEIAELVGRVSVSSRNIIKPNIKENKQDPIPSIHRLQ